MRRLACTVLLFAAFGWAAAEPYDSGSGGVSDTLLRAMSDELERTMEQLRLEDLEAPYFVAYSVLESRTLALHARLGALDRPQQSRTRRLQVELRVGAREFDDTHFVSGRGDYRSLTALLPVEDDYDALRAEIWALTDRAYKLTLERLACSSSACRWSSWAPCWAHWSHTLRLASTDNELESRLSSYTLCRPTSSPTRRWPR